MAEESRASRRYGQSDKDKKDESRGEERPAAREDKDREDESGADDGAMDARREMAKRHEKEHRDLHGQHRQAMRDMHARQEAEMTAMNGRQMGGGEEAPGGADEEAEV